MAHATQSQPDLAQNPPYLPRLSQTGSAKHPETHRNPLTHLGFKFGSNSRPEPKSEWGKTGAKHNQIYEYTASLELLNREDP